MASGNQVNKNRPVDAPLAKRRKVGTGRSIAPTTSSRSRQAPTPVTTNQKEVAAKPSEAHVLADENMDFTKEEVVDALLNEQFKEKLQFSIKAKQDCAAKYIKKLKTCIKWFQKSLEDRTTEKDNLCNMLDSSKRNSAEAEAATKKKEEDFNATIFNLQANIKSLKASLANEVSLKLDALDRHQREKEAKIILEKNQDSLEKKLQRSKNKVSGFKEKVKTHQDTCKQLQEYNTKLQNDLKSATDSKLEVEREKCMILENHSTLQGYYNMLQAGFTSAKDSRDVAVKEVQILRGELQQVREDRERQLLLVKESTSDLARLKESIGCTAVEVDRLRRQSSALEETCSSQRDQISLLQYELADANKKLKVHPDLGISPKTITMLNNLIIDMSER